jgi:DegV family protein with EDD domain
MAVPGRSGEFFAGRSLAGSVAIVTDSTASLPAADPCLFRVAVVPLRLLAGRLVADDGDAPAVAAVEEEAARGERLTTARPPPARFEAAYRSAAAAGAQAVVSVHVSTLLSGTADSAALAADGAPIPVRVVDARTIGGGLGLAVLDAARAAGAGRGPDEIAARAGRYAAGTSSYFALDDADALLAGGRMPAGPPLPSAVRTRLVARPILRIRSGQIVPVERVRTWAAATDQLVELAAGIAGSQAVDLAVEYADAAMRAADLADRLAAVIPEVKRSYLIQASAAIVAHAGPKMLGVTVAPHPPGG